VALKLEPTAIVEPTHEVLSARQDSGPSIGFHPAGTFMPAAPSDTELQFVVNDAQKRVTLVDFADSTDFH
jgi:hypothetical protein